MCCPPPKMLLWHSGVERSARAVGLKPAQPVRSALGLGLRMYVSALNNLKKKKKTRLI